MKGGGSEPHAVDGREGLVGKLEQEDLGELVEVGGHSGHQHVGGNTVKAEVDDV